VDSTTVADIAAGLPSNPAGTRTIEIHGTAANIGSGTLEQRLVTAARFERNGRRTLRADVFGGQDGQMVYDPATTTWTATYTGLSNSDVQTALESESRILWISPNTVDITIYENGAGVVPGPAAPCTAPLEAGGTPAPDGIAPSTPLSLTATDSGNNTVTLSWPSSIDNVGVTAYGIYRDNVAIANVQNGSAPAPTGFVDTGVTGAHIYQVDAADAAGNRSAKSIAALVMISSATPPPPAPPAPPPVVVMTQALAQPLTSASNDLPAARKRVVKKGRKLAKGKVHPLIRRHAGLL
jgi:hypothetical protein